MAKPTIGFGLILIALGVVAYLATGRVSATALIPSFFGLPLAGLGLMALNPARRALAMHLAAGLGLIGLLGSVGGIFKVARLLAGGTVTRPAAAWTQAAMAAVVLVFMVMTVRSFIAARKARKESGDP